MKNLRTDISELRQTIIDSFARLENLLKDLIIGRYPKEEYGKKRNFQFKKKGMKNLQLIDDKKEIRYPRNNERHYCEYNNEYDKSEYSEPRNDNYSTYSLNPKSNNNLSNTSNKDNSSLEVSNSKNDNHHYPGSENVNSIRRRYIKRNQNSEKKKSNDL